MSESRWKVIGASEMCIRDSGEHRCTFQGIRQVGILGPALSHRVGEYSHGLRRDLDVYKRQALGSVPLSAHTM